MRLAAAVLMLALTAPAIASAQAQSRLIDDHTVLIARGERVVVRPSDDGRLTLVSAQVVGDEAAQVPKPGGSLRSGAGNPLNEAEPGTVTFALGYAGEDALLKIDSGISRAFDYRAMLLPELATPMQGRATSVCTVLPLIIGYEHWQKVHPAGLVLGRWTMKDTNEVVCPAPHKDTP